MNRVCLTLIFLSLRALASQIVYYKFGSNFGQAFYDYSGSGNHGQMGKVHQSKIQIPSQLEQVHTFHNNTHAIYNSLQIHLSRLRFE